MGVGPALITGCGQDTFHLVSVKIAELNLALATGPWPLEALQKEKKRGGVLRVQGSSFLPLT